jgi:16S rRNA (cytosine1402-N4)-methyltransferase
VSLIEAAIPVGVRRQSRVHPATQTFAALRLAVNSEFQALDLGAWSLTQVLAPTARLVVLTYSSNEDRTLKRTFRIMAGRAVFREENGPRRKKKSGDFSPEHRSSASMRSSLTLSSLDLDLSQLGAEQAPDWVQGWNEKWKAKVVTPKPIVPSEDEIAANPLSRSCKLRAIEKIEN